MDDALDNLSDIADQNDKYPNGGTRTIDGRSRNKGAGRFQGPFKGNRSLNRSLLANSAYTIKRRGAPITLPSLKFMENA